ncbi:MAG: IPT/TIG domain-containing protein [Pseudonocardiaceae bacterium]
MQIDSVLPNRASPGQSVIIQGDGLASAERVFVGDQVVAAHGRINSSSADVQLVAS